MMMTYAPQLMVLGAVLFALGVVGFLTRRNLIVMFLCTEVMFQGILLNLIAMGLHRGNLAGQALGLFVLVVAAVEAGLGLAIVVLLYRRRGTLDAEAWMTLRG
jgi:NADH-quinone oxidoreductase subunit K